MNRPLNIAHRGGANLWPENTLEAFENAINAGVDGIECDIQHTRDNKLVIHHDDRLKPKPHAKAENWLSGPTPRIRELDREGLTRLMLAACNRAVPIVESAPGKDRLTARASPILTP